MPKPVKIVLITIFVGNILIHGILFLLGAIWAGAFDFLDIRDIATYQSPDGEYSLVIEQVGAPQWPYGPTEVRLTLRNQKGRKIGRVSANVSNDGTDATERNIVSISWNEDSVTVVLRNQEGGREQEVSIPYGKK